MIIEPIITENKLSEVKEALAIFKKDTSGIELDINLLFVAKQNNIITGLIELAPISSKGVLIRRLLSKNQSVAKKLLNESLMYAWEMDFYAAFSDTSNPVYYDCGFEKIDANKIQIPFNCPELLAYSLTYNGVSTFIKEQEYQLN